MNTQWLVLLGAAIIGLCLLAILIRARWSHKRAIASPEVPPGEAEDLSATGPKEGPADSGAVPSRYVLSGNFSGATIHLGANIEDKDIHIGPVDPEDDADPMPAV